MKPALTTSGNTRTATAFDLHVAAAGFCATSCCRARRDCLTKSSADAVRVVSNVTAASVKVIMMGFIDFMVLLLFVGADLRAILLCLLGFVYKTLGLREPCVDNT